MAKPSDTMLLTAKQKAEIRAQIHFSDFTNILNQTFGPIENFNNDPILLEDEDPVLQKVSKTDTGIKHDSQKPRMCLVTNGFPNALTEVAKVATEGAKKYGDYNWLRVENGIERYTNALDRHRLHEGITFDSVNTDDFGLLNATHTAWNSLARLELILREKELTNGTNR